VTFTEALLGFALLATLLTITPGLDTALVLRSAVTQGRGPAFATALGICTGALIWGVAAALGLAALFRASEVAFTILKVVGAAYLIWLGLRLIWTGLIRPRHDAEPTATVPAREGRLISARRGLLTTMLNPKVGAFYLAVLPQFLVLAIAPAAMGALLALVHVALSMIWFSALILAASAIRRFLMRRTVNRAIDGITGAALIGFGTALAFSSRH
jgi:threonine/homoserine/homoserine lactone efflux protein